MDTSPSCALWHRSGCLYLSARTGTSTGQVQRKLPELLCWKKEWVHSQVVLPSAHRWPKHSRQYSSSALSALKLQPARWSYMRSSSLCHQRLKVGRRWCKAELQDLLSAGHLYSLSWALGAPLRVILSPRGKGLPGAGDLQPIPAKTLLSLSSPTEGPVLLPQPQLPPFPETLTFTEFFLFKELFKMPCSQDAACTLSPAQPWARHDFAWKAGTQVPEVTRAFWVDMAEPRCSICLWNHPSLQQVPENGNEPSPQENRVSLKEIAAEAWKRWKSEVSEYMKVQHVANADISCCLTISKSIATINASSCFWAMLCGKNLWCWKKSS